jgi:hypothetical protein
MLEHLTIHAGCVQVPPPTYWGDGSLHLLGPITAGYPAFVRPGVLVHTHDSQGGAMEPPSSKLWSQVSVVAVDDMAGTATVVAQVEAGLTHKCLSVVCLRVLPHVHFFPCVTSQWPERYGFAFACQFVYMPGPMHCPYIVKSFFIFSL